jgi:carbon-monoxide dehydrogenase medium subunit
MAGVFVARHKDGSIRVAVTGAGNDGVFRWSEAEQALGNNFSAEALKGLTVPVSRMMGDIHGSPEYRAHLCAVMARRAIEHQGTALAMI